MSAAFMTWFGFRHMALVEHLSFLGKINQSLENRCPNVSHLADV